MLATNLIDFLSEAASLSQSAFASSRLAQHGGATSAKNYGLHLHEMRHLKTVLKMIV